jgi:DNA-binding response OmpR family regulator
MDAPRRILAVDDEPSVATSFRFIFDASNYEVTSVDCGSTALAKLEVAPDAYDIIIVDQKMPDLTGVELVDTIRKRGISSSIIVVSAHLSSDIRAAYERMGVDAMLAKPFNVEQLRSVVDQVARSR